VRFYFEWMGFLLFLCCVVFGMLVVLVYWEYFEWCGECCIYVLVGGLCYFF